MFPHNHFYRIIFTFLVIIIVKNIGSFIAIIAICIAQDHMSQQFKKVRFADMYYYNIDSIVVIVVVYTP